MELSRYVTPLYYGLTGLNWFFNNLCASRRGAYASYSGIYSGTDLCVYFNLPVSL